MPIKLICTGHGAYEGPDDYFVLPRNVSVTFFASPGMSLDDDLGNRIHEYIVDNQRQRVRDVVVRFRFLRTTRRTHRRQFQHGFPFHRDAVRYQRDFPVTVHRAGQEPDNFISVLNATRLRWFYRRYRFRDGMVPNLTLSGDAAFQYGTGIKVCRGRGRNIGDDADDYRLGAGVEMQLSDIIARYRQTFPQRELNLFWLACNSYHGRRPLTEDRYSRLSIGMGYRVE